MSNPSNQSNKSSIENLLNTFRNESQNTTEQGKLFEKVIRKLLLNDPVYTPQFSEVWFFADWAKEQGQPIQDRGIDLVAKNKADDKYTAIQCKFLEGKNVPRDEIDSFVASAAADPAFSRLILADTTDGGLGKNSDDLIKNSAKPFTRITKENIFNSGIDWNKSANSDTVVLKPKKKMRPHQQEALKKVCAGLQKEDSRGKLIMACGSGKTFTSLKIAEKLAGKGKLVLYLVPSLALMAQTIREWANDSDLQLNAYATCSDVTVGTRKPDQDTLELNQYDLAYPATTNAKSLASKFLLHPDKLNIIYTTYHSIEVISQAQKKYNLPEAELIICDEAHRTTGANIEGADESEFTKVHDNSKVAGKRRLYMTATPKIYSDKVKEKAKEAEALLLSMDDESLYGDTLYELSFDEAVAKELLCDYKVIILAMDEQVVSDSLQQRLKDEDSTLKLDDATKVIGCYKALTKRHSQKDLSYDLQPIKRAVAFCGTIKSSKAVVEEFPKIIDEYKKYQEKNQVATPADERDVHCELDHVDGTYDANKRQERLNWLEANPAGDYCRILSNAKCLSEGVDVPTLDAIIFMHPRKSQIDIVQAVGRAMRKADGKTLGYVILPVAISPGVPPETALKNHSKYKSLWQVLNALRSHDKNLDMKINQGGLGEDISDKIEIEYYTSDSLPSGLQKKPETDEYSMSIGKDIEGTRSVQESAKSEYLFVNDEVTKAIMDKLVEKCGTRTFWLDWANDIKDIADNHMTRIKTAIKDEQSDAHRAFNKFLQEIRDDLNKLITDEDAIEMLAQHLITKPVFDAVFAGADFATNNPVSQAMDKVLNALAPERLDKEAETLDKFYHDVKRHAFGLETPAAKQALIVELYDKFFSRAFANLQKKLGIVYTPIELVDFIIHSVNDVLQAEFGKRLGSEGVHILDPFTGTGSFIVRMIQSGLLSKEELIQKYQRRKRLGSDTPITEIHANEIVLLAYYIACINIEHSYHAATKEEYKPFDGILLTDTFDLSERGDLIQRLLVDNSHRRVAQKNLEAIQVIMGNPPYSMSQGNMKYANLDKNIEETYAKHSTAALKQNLYDSYIRAIKWASNRIGENGVVGFVTGSGFITKQTMGGMRKCLAKDFSSLYIINLRGDIRKQMLSGDAGEGGNIFGQGSQTGIALSILVRNPQYKKGAKDKNLGKIYYHDIGDNLSTEDKKQIISKLISVGNISKQEKWQEITPDKHNDWLEHRDDSFYDFIPLAKINDNNNAIFVDRVIALVTNRDVWCYNSSTKKLQSNMQKTIEFYNSEVDRFTATPETDKNRYIADKEKAKLVDEFLSQDDSKIKWTRGLKQKLMKQVKNEFDANKITECLYRPFTKVYLYKDPLLNEAPGRMHKFFPTESSGNLMIGVSDKGSANFSVLMTDRITDKGALESAQCFPLKIYTPTADVDKESKHDGLYVQEDNNLIRDGISDAGLEHFHKAYAGKSGAKSNDKNITKEDIFYYVYGILHSPEYRSRYGNNLSKELPHIPCVKAVKDFWAFSQAGRDLSELHINYENVQPYAATFNCDINKLSAEDFYVKKMKHPNKPVKTNDSISATKSTDLSTIIYNGNIIVSDIPESAYDYKINGRSAIKWVMERQAIRTDKESGIINNANDYAMETQNNPRYPLDLLLKVINVSLGTNKIIKSLPSLNID
ncbi:MAG: DEAD/DEAH box helicase [Candidatus Portiera sp.]|nr:DEAD/DEAH box helicase [Portiera sp.]